MTYYVAGFFSGILFSLIVALNIASYREGKRRKLLSKEEQDALKREDAAFMQTW